MFLFIKAHTYTQATNKKYTFIPICTVQIQMLKNVYKHNYFHYSSKWYILMRWLNSNTWTLNTTQFMAWPVDVSLHSCCSINAINMTGSGLPQHLSSSRAPKLARVFFMRRAVRRAAAFWYQHSFINLLITRKSYERRHAMLSEMFIFITLHSDAFMCGTFVNQITIMILDKWLRQCQSV